MNPPLKPTELDMVRSVFSLHPEIETATLSGSRAKGTHSERSDVDLVVTGVSDHCGPKASRPNSTNFHFPTGLRSSHWLTSAIVHCSITSGVWECEFIRLYEGERGKNAEFQPLIRRPPDLA